MISLNAYLNSITKIINFSYLKKRMHYRFILGVIKQLYWESKHSDSPWLTPDSVDLLEGLLKRSDCFLEFGSGQSTKWFANRVKQITSVESDIKWYQKISLDLKNYKNLNYIYAKKKKEYLAVLKKIDKESVDACLVDGDYRIDCLLQVLDKIKKGGLLILDNAETFLPIKWKSASFQDSYKNRGLDKKKIRLVIAKLSSWKMISTSTVVQDTIIWIK